LQEYESSFNKKKYQNKEGYADDIKKLKKGVTIKRGSFISSVKKIAEETDLSVDKIRTALKHLKDTEEITTVGAAKYTVFTVVNYEKYQNDTEQNPEVNTEQCAEQIPNKSLLSVATGFGLGFLTSPGFSPTFATLNFLQRLLPRLAAL
jgi:DNA-binding transcriptional regulator YhcF (GntR family)